MSEEDRRSRRDAGNAPGPAQCRAWRCVSCACSLLVAALVTRLAKQLAVLLLRHALTALLDDRAHETSQCCGRAGMVARSTGLHAERRESTAFRTLVRLGDVPH